MTAYNPRILNYTSHGHGCGFYSELIFVDSKALKWAHSRLRNYFSNAAIGQRQPIENRIRDRAKYILTAPDSR